ncbi:short-chain dehydrogenase [Foetidibacter luteolus]|uniref:short-chain dehydrogenase n=1 Tax=Foetidibacter luteolus TaxID=2608880 RepID=UPI00129A34C8|nr:short-chain dehydrogenase [Foetidibacter luteolus]
MTNEQIEKFLSKNLFKSPVKIHFKTRNALTGLFIQTPDYQDLKSKNFWRIVVGDNMNNWMKKPDNNLARIFSGSEITKLSEA